jgi:phosphodiesterase/alkaline phosphatase D-like protein
MNSGPMNNRGNSQSVLRGGVNRVVKRWHSDGFLFLCYLLAGIAFPGASAWAQCSSPANPVVAENCLTGNAASEWDVSGTGDTSIQGFSTDISVNAGQTIVFKISTDATSYKLDIYRLGYYAGLGARKVATVNPSVSLPQTQPACLTDAATHLVDCGNWANSAFWAVPSTATSGVYIAVLRRADTGGASHIMFVVRNDTSTSTMLFQTSDTTWQAYNNYGGFSLYFNRAFKVSYNRPNVVRGENSITSFFDAEYPMVRWLEANGYDVSYFTGVDANRSGQLITNHKIYLSVGHDEYWSATQRANVEAARTAGVHLAFFSANELFWKTRWENSIDGTNTANRTLVCYKETAANAKIDPTTSWTGTWRDARFSPPSDGGRPENALSGTIFMVNGLDQRSIQVPAADGKMRIWRNTTVASAQPGDVAVFPVGTLGFEWDIDADNGFRPAGLIHLSSATYNLSGLYLLDNGSVFGNGTATHNVTMYRSSSGSLVFGAGTVRWSWGLDSVHDNLATQTDARMQQATVNLFADMGVQPGSIQPGLLPAFASTDTVPPTSTIVSPASGSSVTVGTPVTVSGTATDFGGGVVGGVEVSTDGGQTWHPAVGRESWTYLWTPVAAGAVSIQVRATDDSLRTQTSVTSISINIAANGSSIWGSVTPQDSGDNSAVEVGLKFRSDVDGVVNGIRFYKVPFNTGTHTGHVWSNTGTLLGTVTFSGESLSGWQQANFAAPVPVTANTTYIVSYFCPSGHYANSSNYFGAAIDNPPLHALANGFDGPNGVFVYSPVSSFPNVSGNSENYWVDPVFATLPPVLSAVAATPAATTATITWTSSKTATSRVDYGTSAATLTLNVSNASLVTSHSIPLTGLTAGMTYYYRVTSVDSSGNTVTSPISTSAPASFTTTLTAPPVITAVSVTPGLTTATITWTTDALSTSRVDYGTAQGSLTLNTTAGTYVTSHSVTLSGLSNATTYYYRVTSADSFGNSATSPVTAGPPASFSTIDPNPPIITAVTVLPGVGGTASVTWTTNKVATSRIDYGTAAASLTLNVSDPTLATSHSLNLFGLTPGASYFYRVTSVDASGNTASSPVSPATASFVENGVSLWAPSVTPGLLDGGDSNSLEVGLKFRSDVAGAVTGVRFYKAAANTGTHTGHLWTGSGTLLASVTFSGETASGWQQANFATPVSIAANTTYVVSYFDPNGHYSYNAGYFSTGTDNAPLHALANGVDGPNAVYLYSAVSAFPSVGGNAANYWVDTVFVDNVAPLISAVAAVPTATAATITWTTDEASTSRVDYETSPTALTLNASSAAAGTAHSLSLAGLTTGSVYYYRVTSVDSSGNSSTVPTASAAPATFTARTSVPPVITAVNVTPGSTTATITWTTDTNSTSRVDYGTAPGALTLNITAASLVTGHSITLTGLTATTTYYYRVTSVDSSGNSVTSPVTTGSPASFITVDPNPPVITAVSAESQVSGAATISWTTNKLSTSRVDYGTSAASLTLNVSDPTMTTSQRVNLSGLTLGTTYFYRVTSVDAASNTASSPVAPATASFIENNVSVWAASVIPGTVDAGDPNALEVGMKFRSDSAGVVTGVRFYKSAANTGVHIGNLWTSTGTLLGTITFTNETASGWQQANFAAPVSINANTTYIVSTFMPAGHYSANGAFFSAAVDAPPLHGLANGTDGPNGLYHYGATSAFPASTFNAANYWVDVVFH